MTDAGEEEMMELSGNEDDDMVPGRPAGGTGAYGTADDLGEDEADEGEDGDRPQRDPVDYELLMSV
jgi:hypothetical protein